MFAFLRNILAAFAFAALLFVNTASAAEDWPEFSQFPAEVYRGPVASLKWDDEILSEDCDHVSGLLEASRNAAFRNYRETAGNTKYPHRFGGHYVVLSFQCGVKLDVLFDVRTGEFSGLLPDSVTGYYYRADSSLLIMNAEVPALEEYDCYYDNATFFLVRKDGFFRLLAEKPWPGRRIVLDHGLSRLISKTPLGPLSPTGTGPSLPENIISALPPRLKKL